jgi:acetyltransferase-like isoleucine patch superfamily enzyme
VSVLGLIQNVLASYRLRAGINRIGISGRLWLHGPGSVTVGKETHFDGGAIGIELLALEGAELRIGERCRLCEGVSIEASHSVLIGDRVHLGPFAKIIDSNFHALRGDRHERPPPESVVIEDRVELGERVIVLPGVTIGAGAKVRPRSVVNRRVPPGAEVAGNPARPVRR